MVAFVHFERGVRPIRFLTTGSLLVAVAAAVGLVHLGAQFLRASQPPIVVLTSRAISRVQPPWTYDSDRFRLDGTVAEPLCPYPARAPSGARPAEPLATSCVPDAVGRVIRVTLRPEISFSDGSRVDEPDVIRALEAFRKRAESAGEDLAWTEVSAPDRGVLEVTVKEGKRESALVELAQTPVTWGEGDTLEGTGAYRLAGVWRRREEEPPDLGVLLGAGLRPYAQDLTRLERCVPRVFGRFRACREVWVVGVEAETQADASGLAAVVTAGLQDGTLLGVHLIELPLRDAMEREVVLSADVPRWDFAERTQGGVLWAVINPRLPDAERAMLHRALSALRNGAEVMGKVGGGPAFSLFPAELGQRPLLPSEPSPMIEEPSRGSPVVILTNYGWGGVARVTASAMSAWAATDQVVAAYTEASLRRAGCYTVSILKMSSRMNLGAAEFLAGALPAWFVPLKEEGSPPEHCQTPEMLELPIRAENLVVRASALSERAQAEGDAAVADELDELAGDVAEWVVPLAAAPRRVAVSRRLEGWDPLRQDIVPGALGDSLDPEPPYAVAGLLVVLVLAPLGIAYVERRADREQRRVADEVAGLHHDITAPLSATLHLVARLPAAEGERIAALVRQAAEVIDEVDLLVDPDKMRIERKGTCALREQLDTERVRLEGLAAGEKLPAPTVILRGDALDSWVALGPVATGRIFRNLFENALHYRSGDQVTIEVEVTASAGKVSVTVADQGRGIPDADRRRVFDRGYRGASTGRKGRGLGLAIVRSIARGVGGEVELVSGGTPTAFRVLLPAAVPATLPPSERPWA